MKRKWLSKDRRQMADYEKISPACAEKKKKKRVSMCKCLFMCVLLWPSTSLHGSTSKAAFTEFLLLHLLLLLVSVCVCAVLEQCLLELGALAGHHYCSEASMPCPLAHLQGTPIYKGPD